MSNKPEDTTSADIQLFVMLGAIALALYLFSTNIDYLIESKLIWLIPILFIGGFFLIRSLQKKAKERRTAREKLIEENRINEIMKNKNHWGESFCNWLVDNGHDINDKRIFDLSNKIEEWGEETVIELINHKIGIGFTNEMVRLTLGEPTSVDMQEITEKHEKYRWIYGIQRQGAVYIWFKDHKITKIKQ